MKRADLEHLAFSKLAARREKDLKFVGALLGREMVRPSRLIELPIFNDLLQNHRPTFKGH